MATPDFKSMSYDELLDYALEHGEGCGALEEYVKRQQNDPQTITLNPNIESNWYERLIAAIRQIETETQSIAILDEL